MRYVPYEKVVEAVSALAMDTNRFLPDDVLDAVKRARANEDSPGAAAILDEIIENARIAAEESIPLCQDTGLAVVFVEMGEDVRVDGKGIGAAIEDGIRDGYRRGGLRMSVVADPFRRSNTGDNSPPIIHYRIFPGEILTIFFCPKGGGSENASALAMLSPGDGLEGVARFLMETVARAGGRPCPPILAGVGIGGNFEQCAELAKRALLRRVGERNPDPFYAEFERGLLGRLNGLGIGPMGLGGGTTALDVFIETEPCHIASLPVAVNIQCHSARHGMVEL